MKYTLNFPPQRCHISVYFFFPRICIKNGAMSYTLLCDLLLGVNMFARQFLYSSIFYTKLLSGHSRGHDERKRKFSLPSGACGVGERPSVGNSPRQRGEGSPSSLPKSCCRYCNRQWFFFHQEKKITAAPIHSKLIQVSREVQFCIIEVCRGSSQWACGPIHIE